MADSNATDSATAAVGSRSEDQENQEDVPVVDCQGELSLRTKKFLFWSATKKHVALKGTKLALCVNSTTLPEKDAVHDVAGCSLNAIESPIGFSIKIKSSGSTLLFQCADEDDQSKWMGAIFEAKLKQASATADTCSIM